MHENVGTIPITQELKYDHNHFFHFKEGSCNIYMYICKLLHIIMYNIFDSHYFAEALLKFNRKVAFYHSLTFAKLSDAADNTQPVQ